MCLHKKNININIHIEKTHVVNTHTYIITKHYDSPSLR